MSSAAFRQAMVTQDREGVIAALAPGVVLHSPILSVPFEGRDAVGDLAATVSRTVEGLSYSDAVPDGEREVAFFHGRVGRHPLEGVDVFSFDDQGLITEMTVYFRPLQAVAAFVKAIGPHVGRSRRHSLVLRAGGPILPAVAAMTDSVARRAARLK